MAAPQRLWVDHSRNEVLGWTLTISVGDGTKLIAGLSVLVTLTGGAAWTIVAYLLHQYRASSNPTDALRLEEQIVLRNSTSPASDAWHLLMMAWAWRKVGRNFFRPLGLLLIPLLLWAVFIVLGIFVSNVAAPSYQASRTLIAPGLCGVPSPAKGTAGAFALAYKLVNDTQLAKSYSQQCYHGQRSSLDCDYFPIQALAYNTSSVPCPWPGNRCAPASGAYQMYTDWIDSHVHLGINAKKSDRVQVRMVNTCSVIHDGDLVDVVPDNTTDGQSDFVRFYLGPIPGVTSFNWTYQYATHSVNDDIPYSVVATYNYANNTGGVQAVPALARNDADQSFIFIASNSVTFDSPTTDPLFTANGSTTAADGRIGPDILIHIVVCMDQRQVRNPNNNVTTLLQGYSTLALTGSGNWQTLGLNPAQNATLLRIMNNMYGSDTYNNVNGMNAAALQATDKLFQLFSPGLPDDQWQIELRGWFETGLAKFQRSIINYADNTWLSNAGDISNAITVLSPESEPFPETRKYLVKQCSSQTIRSIAAYQSFTMVGIIIIAVVSIATVILSWTLSTCVRKRYRNSTTNHHRYIADVAHGKLVLLKLALQASGYQEWQSNPGDVPVRDRPTPDIFPARGSVDELRFPTGNQGDMSGPRDSVHGQPDEFEFQTLNGGRNEVEGDSPTLPSADRRNGYRVVNSSVRHQRRPSESQVWLSDGNE